MNLTHKGYGTSKGFEMFGRCVKEIKTGSSTDYSAMTIVFLYSNFLNMRYADIHFIYLILNRKNICLLKSSLSLMSDILIFIYNLACIDQE